MKDIKSLYLTAKSSGKSSDISAYTEAVNELLASNPKDYMLNLEYIISSDIGLETFDSFIEKYGLSIAAYDDVMICFEKCIGKCERDGKDASKYQEKKEKLEEFKEQHMMCFNMFESFMSDYIACPVKEFDEELSKFLTETRKAQITLDDYAKKNKERLRKKYNYNNGYIYYNGMTIKYDDDINNPYMITPTGEKKLRSTCCFGRQVNGKMQGHVVMSADSLRTTSFKSAESALLHEVGHLLKNVITSDTGNIKSEMKKDTLNKIEAKHKNNYLSHQNTDEYEADAFAANQLGHGGRKTVINSLNKSYDDQAKRKNIIKDIKTREKIKKKKEMTNGNSNQDPIRRKIVENDIKMEMIDNLFMIRPDIKVKFTEYCKDFIDNEYIDDYGMRNAAFAIVDPNTYGRPNSENYIKLFEDCLSRQNIGITLQDFIRKFNDRITPAKPKSPYSNENIQRVRNAIKNIKSVDMGHRTAVLHDQGIQNTPWMKEYVDVYYSSNDKGVQNSRLLVGMIDTFGECAIPDALITASKFGGSALSTSLKYLESVEDFQTAGHFQWISECTKEVAPEGYSNDILTEMESLSLQAIVDGMRSRNRAVFREATLSGNENAIFEYSEEELMALDELIAFKEYQLTCMENADDIVRLQNEIYSLYEEFDGMEGESAGIIADMLPPSSDGKGEITESPWMVNTRNKKTGDAPSWLSNNHDLDYDADGTKPKSSDSEDSVEDFKRPSAGGHESNSDDSESDYQGSSNTSSANPSGSTNNYYYYTYNNSLNKNSNSFNKDNSSHDNHSKHDHSVTNDSSVHNSTRRVTDDHSTNKRVHSHDYNTPAPGDDDDDIQEESGRPWEVGNFLHNTVYTEGLFGKSPDNRMKLINYIPLSEYQYNSIMSRIEKLESELNAEFDPLFSRYPIYKLSMSIDRKYINEYLYLNMKDTSMGYGIHVENGHPVFDIELELSGNDQNEFIQEIETNHPEEIQRLSKIYNLDNRYNWTKIQWDERICGYDKTLSEIMNDVSNSIMSKQFIHEFRSVGDNDSGPVYTGKIDINYICEGIDMSNIQSTTVRLESVYTEDVGDIDDLRPESDHPIKDTLMDVDRKLVRGGQKIKKGVQNVQNAGRAAMKPVNRATGWVGKVIADWKDADETKIKEKMADPHARNNLFSAIGTCIKTGSLLKAGLLFNPIFLFLSVTKRAGKNKNEFRLRNEMIGEIKMELEIIDKKIEDARDNGDKNASYKLMRLKNELNKKLARVGGGKGAAKSL